MNRLRKQFKEAKRASAPSPAFKKALWADLDVEFDAVHACKNFVPWYRMAMVPVAALVLFAVTGTGVYAYTSNDVTQDSPMYSVRHGLEIVEERIPKTQRSRQRFNARMIERRLQESEVMFREGKMTETQLTDIGARLNVSFQELSDQASAEVQEGEPVDEVLFNYLQIQNQRFKNLLETNPSIDEAEIPSLLERSPALRNKIEEIRVHIQESDLGSEAKNALLERLPTLPVDANEVSDEPRSGIIK
jgi:hypothetical protein